MDGVVATSWYLFSAPDPRILVLCIWNKLLVNVKIVISFHNCQKAHLNGIFLGFFVCLFVCFCFVLFWVFFSVCFLLVFICFCVLFLFLFFVLFVSLFVCLFFNLKINLFLWKIHKVYFCDSDSLWCQMKSYCYFFLVSIERRGPFLPFSTKIIRIWGFMAKVYKGRGGNHTPLVDMLQKKKNK